MINDTTQLYFPVSGTTGVPLLFEPQVLRCAAAGPIGRPLTVLLDTGTDPSAIDLGLARRLGLRLGDFALGQSAASNSVPFTETCLPWLRIGDLAVRNLFALALDLSNAPFDVDIVLGYNVLRQMVLHIDYARHIIHVSHPDVAMPTTSSHGELLSLAFFEHFPALTDICLDDSMHLPLATIDTGSNGGLTVGPDLAQRLGLRRDATTVVTSQGSGFDSSCEVLLGQASRVRVGSFCLEQIELDTPGHGAGDLRRAGRANIGNRLLSRFASVTLDYERRRCWLEPYLDT